MCQRVMKKTKGCDDFKILPEELPEYPLISIQRGGGRATPPLPSPEDSRKKGLN